MSKKSFINSIEVKSPCSEDWNEMRGNGQVRFCSHCNLNVNNLSAMTRKEVLKLVRKSEGRICVRYVKNPKNNAPLFVNELYQISRRAPRLAVSVMATALSLSSMAYAQGGISINNVLQTPTEVSQKDLSDENKIERIVASVSGTVTDVNGAVISGTKITLINQKNNESRSTTSNDDGFYEFKDVTAGVYKLRVEANYFKTSEINDVIVENASDIKQNSVLEVSGESVTVGGAMFVDYEQPLLKAVSDDDFEEVQTLIVNGANVNAKDKNYGKITALFVAVENGNLEIAETLLNFGAKVNVPDKEKQTPLMRLDDDATPELVRLLIKHGAKVNLKDKEGNTALILASGSAKAQVLQVLLDHKADVNAQNSDGQSALMNAVGSDNLESVRTLILSGANVNLKNNNGDTVLSMTNSEEIEQILRQYGARE